MNNILPLVSVIIPTYKRSDSLPHTIDSVINQTYQNIEIIVVDDNGEGTPYQIQTEERLKKYINDSKIKYIKHHKNKNGSAARNTGFRASHGEYINFLDDDDSFMPTKIEKQIEVLSLKGPEFGAIYCNTRVIERTSIRNKIHQFDTNFTSEGMIVADYLMGRNMFNTSTILFRRDVIDTLEGFDERFLRHQDFELMTRFFVNYKIACIKNDPLLIYDVSSERINIPKIEEYCSIKRFFLSTFQVELKKWGIWEELNYDWWMKCCRLAMASSHYKMVFQIWQEARKYKKNIIHESLLISLVLCKKLLFAPIRWLQLF